MTGQMTNELKTKLLPALYQTFQTETVTQSEESLYPSARQIDLFAQAKPDLPLATTEFRLNLLAFEDAARRQLAPVACKTVHHFFPGLYAREFHMPANSVVTSKIHRHDYLIILVQGRVTMRTEQGGETFEALSVMPAFAGVKRLLFSHEDCVFITAHPNPSNTRDLMKLEDDLIISDLNEWARCPEPTTDWSACPIVEEDE
jgi:hypothetical protein